jgi:hypothetical protein
MVLYKCIIFAVAATLFSVAVLEHFCAVDYYTMGPGVIICRLERAVLFA